MADFQNWSDDEDNPADMELIENGHITSNPEENPNSSDDDDDDDPDPCSNGEFDRDIPTTHRYLGKLNNVRGYTLYDDGEIFDTLAIYTTTMVFPGFTLPLILNNVTEVSLIQPFIEKNNIFVLLCYESATNRIFNFGVTMEIFETQMRGNALHIKARGRQRCELVRVIKNSSVRFKQVTIKIKAEHTVSSPLCDTQMICLKQKRPFISPQFSDILKKYKYRRYHLAQYPFASWVYDRYEVSYYVKMLLEGLAHYVGEYIPNDPVKLSYWFVQNYQLSHEERIHILKLNSTLERLKLECRYLKLKRSICCERCGIQVADPSKVFAMSKDGIQSNYVNPGGHVYETVTVKIAQNFRLIGEPSKEFSWFPGYLWTNMQCIHCNSHLGWRFTSPNLKPKSFYGLAKSCIRVDIKKKAPTEFEQLHCGRTTFTQGYIPV